MSYRTLITTLGQAKIAAAIANASLVNLYEMALGDGNGNPTTPAVSQTSLVREVHRAQLNSLTTDPSNPNYLIAELVVPVDVGGWTVREVGLFDNAGAMIAVGNFPDTYKPNLVEGAGRDLVVRMIIEVAQPDVITLTIDPGIVLATRQWVSDNFTLAIVLPGGTTGEVLRKASNADGDFEWWDPTSGANIIVNTVQETQTLAASQTAVTLADATTVGVALYVEGVRLHPDDFTIVNETDITLATSYPADSQLLAVQNEPLGSFHFLAVANNLSEIEDAGPSAQAEAIANLGLANNADFLAAIRTNVFGALYPIGEILITRRAGNPNSWLGFGTWERYGKGRSIIGYDDLDASFNTLDATGGAKTHTLIGAEMPAHTHTVNPPATNTSSSGAHSHNIDPPSSTTSSGGAHTHSYRDRYYVENSAQLTASTNKEATPASYNASKGPNGTDSDNDTFLYLDSVTGSSGAHTHTVDIAPFTSDSGGTHTHSIDIAEFNSGSTGTGQAHNNLHPYIVAYMWKRTA